MKIFLYECTLPIVSLLNTGFSIVSSLQGEQQHFKHNTKRTQERIVPRHIYNQLSKLNQTQLKSLFPRAAGKLTIMAEPENTHIIEIDKSHTVYINTLKAGAGLSEAAIRDGYTRFKKDKDHAELSAIATQHGLAPAALQTFVDSILQRLILDTDALTDLMAPQDLGWKARAQAETALMAALIPLLTKRAQGRDISGLSAYD
jgi:hypothetical protein